MVFLDQEFDDCGRFYREIIEKSMDCKLRRNPDTGAHGCESRIDPK